MKTPRERVIARLRKDRPIVTLPVQLREEIVEDLIEVAEANFVRDAETLARQYILEGLRHDIMRLRTFELSRDSIEALAVVVFGVRRRRRSG
jgi:hypothetical protein